MDKIFVNLKQNIENSYKLDDFSLDSKPIFKIYSRTCRKLYLFDGKLKSNNFELNKKIYFPLQAK